MEFRLREWIMSLAIRPLAEADLDTADRILRIAFNQFLGLKPPTDFFGDSDYARTRWRTAPTAALGAYLHGELVGSNFLSCWGSFGFFGPLSVHPDRWGERIASGLLEATVETFTDWKTEIEGLFTFAQSPEHIRLYQRYGFWPRFLTMIMSRPVVLAISSAEELALKLITEDSTSVRELRELTEEIYPGLDLEREIMAVRTQSLGHVVTIQDRGLVGGMAVCHVGPKTEAGDDACYVKFGGVRPGAGSEPRFDRLLDACDSLARHNGVSRLVLGVNTACVPAYRRLLERGFRTDMQGVAMHRNDLPGYFRSDSYVVCDWR